MDLLKEMIHIRTDIPGRRSLTLLKKLKQLNGGWAEPLPFVHSGRGQGCYFYDVDGNKFLDFASQVASNPLGYNHPRLLKVVRQYQTHPVKYAGQDFTTKEHIHLLEELISISKGMDAAFLINSGAEAVENAIKIALRKQTAAKFGVSFESGFHGRTLGALSCANSKRVHKEHYFTFPMHRLPYDHTAGDAFQRILEQEGSEDDIGFIIIEPIQGEGGYNIPSNDLMQDISQLCRKHHVPLIVDEIQSGLGRTGKWWAHQHFDFHPDIITSAKALQVGAVVSKKNMFPKESGAISSTWGGGHILDMALGLETIRVIREYHLLEHNRRMGDYLKQKLFGLDVYNVRGIGLMCAFDLEDKKTRDNVFLQIVKHGVAVLPCGTVGIRLIPPYIVTEKDVDIAISVIDVALQKCRKKGFRHKGPVCEVHGC